MLQLNADGAVNENHAMNELTLHEEADVKATTNTCARLYSAGI